MTILIFLIVIIAFVVWLGRKAGRDNVPKKQDVQQSPQETNEFLIEKGEEFLQTHPNLSKADPEAYCRIVLGLVRLYNKTLLLVDWNLARTKQGASWRDHQIAVQVKKWADRAKIHAAEYCSVMKNKLDAEAKEAIAFAYAMKARIARIDYDAKMADEYNRLRLRYENPSEIDERTIDGMLVDAAEAGGPSGAVGLLDVFNELAEQDSEWDKVTPVIRKVMDGWKNGG